MGGVFDCLVADDGERGTLGVRLFGFTGGDVVGHTQRLVVVAEHDFKCANVKVGVLGVEDVSLGTVVIVGKALATTGEVSLMVTEATSAIISSPDEVNKFSRVIGAGENTGFKLLEDNFND